MSFSSQLAAASTLIVAVLGDSLSLTIHPQTGGSAVTGPAITKNPALEEDWVPGSAVGVSVLILWALLSLFPTVSNGDTATVNSVDYDVIQTNVDLVGGVTIKLRRRNKAWNA